MLGGEQVNITLVPPAQSTDLKQTMKAQCQNIFYRLINSNEITERCTPNKEIQSAYMTHRKLCFYLVLSPVVHLPHSKRLVHQVLGQLLPVGPNRPHHSCVFSCEGSSEGWRTVVVVKVEGAAFILQLLHETEADVMWSVAEARVATHHFERPHVARRGLTQFIQFDSPFGWFVAHVDSASTATAPRTKGLVDADILAWLVQAFKLLHTQTVLFAHNTMFDQLQTQIHNAGSMKYCSHIQCDYTQCIIIM